MPATSQTVSLCAAAPVWHVAVLGLVACAPAKSRAPFPHYQPASSIQPCIALEGQGTAAGVSWMHGLAALCHVVFRASAGCEQRHIATGKRVVLLCWVGHSVRAGWHAQRRWLSWLVQAALHAAGGRVWFICLLSA